MTDWALPKAVNPKTDERIVAAPLNAITKVRLEVDTN